MRNPNGYGSVTKLSGNRRRPYVVRKTIGWTDEGYPIYNVIGYTATREEGNILLAEYNRNPWNVEQSKITLQQLFELWKEKKAPRLEKSNRASLCAAFNHCKKLDSMPYKTIKAYQMQETIDNCSRGYSTQATIKNLWAHLDRFAIELDIITRSYSELLTSEPVPPTTRRPFSDEEVQTLWKHQSEPWIDTVLILIYSGWRISEFLNLEPDDIDLSKNTMKGGTKTAAGKNRIVPIHPDIKSLICARLDENGPKLICYDGCACSVRRFRTIWNKIMERLKFWHEDHLPLPHECRHTLETKLDSAGANRKCIDLIMGHKSTDVGNRVYNHKTIEELENAIALINFEPKNSN